MSKKDKSSCQSTDWNKGFLSVLQYRRNKIRDSINFTYASFEKEMQDYHVGG